jgi:hypothetical protein
VFLFWCFEVNSGPIFVVFVLIGLSLAYTHKITLRYCVCGLNFVVFGRSGFSDEILLMRFLKPTKLYLLILVLNTVYYILLNYILLNRLCLRTLFQQ